MNRAVTGDEPPPVDPEARAMAERVEGFNKVDRASLDLAHLESLRSEELEYPPGNDLTLDVGIWDNHPIILPVDVLALDSNLKQLI